MEKAIKLIDTLSTWLGIPISWLYVALMLIITYDVTLRYFFSYRLYGLLTTLS